MKFILPVSFLGILYSIFYLDQNLANYYSDPAQQKIRLLAREITDIGLGEYWIGLSIIGYVLARLAIAVNPKSTFLKTKVLIKNWCVLLFCGLISSGLVLWFFKAVLGRQRPHKSEMNDALVFEPLTLDWHFHSMPSGHTQVLFSVCAALCLIFPRARYAFITLAALLAFTRVMTLQHFLSDVIAGALLGFFFSAFIHSKLKNKYPVDIQSI